MPNTNTSKFLVNKTYSVQMLRNIPKALYSNVINVNRVDLVFHRRFSSLLKQNWPRSVVPFSAHKFANVTQFRNASQGLPSPNEEINKSATKPKETTLQRWIAKGKEELHHTVQWVKTGSKLFAANVKVSSQLGRRFVLGYPLTRRERALLNRTIMDCFKLIPFSFFIIVPLAEFLLPFYIKFFPRMLPSTFAQTDEKEYLTKIKSSEQLAKFFQQVVSQKADQLLETIDDSKIEKKKLLLEFQDKMIKNSTGTIPELKELLPFAKLFKEEFKLDSLNLKTLQTISRLLGITPYGFQKYVVLQLRYHMLKIQSEDRKILWEGVESLTHDELVEICKNRAMKFYDISDDEMRKQVSVWIEAASHPDVPIVLLLWSRCMTITHHVLETEREFIKEPVEDTPKQ